MRANSTNVLSHNLLVKVSLTVLAVPCCRPVIFQSFSYLLWLRFSQNWPRSVRSTAHLYLKGTMSALKALEGSETEQRVLLGGMEKNIVSLMRGHFCAHVFWVPGGQIFFLPICSPNICCPDTSLHSAQPTYYFIVTHSSICIPDNA